MIYMVEVFFPSAADVLCLVGRLQVEKQDQEG